MTPTRHNASLDTKNKEQKPYLLRSISKYDLIILPLGIIFFKVNAALVKTSY